MHIYLKWENWLKCGRQQLSPAPGGAGRRQTTRAAPPSPEGAAARTVFHPNPEQEPEHNQPQPIPTP